MAEKNCTKCGKKLRASRDGKVHVDCNRCRRGLTAESKADADDAVLDRTAVKPPPPRAKSDAVKRFKVVADALGHDSEAIINDFCEGWLANLKQKAAEG